MSNYSITINVNGGRGSKKNANGANGTTGGVGGANGGGTGDSAGGGAGQLAQGSGGSSIAALKKVAVATGVLSAGKKTLDYVTSRVYTETGNRQLQDNINATKQIGGQIASIAGGFVVGGWVGGLAAMSGVALDYALQYRSYNFAKEQEASVLSIRRERMGAGGMANSRSRALNQ